MRDPAPARFRRLLPALVAALGFTLVLNAWSLGEAAAGRLAPEYLDEHGIDERYYFAMIAKIGQGNPVLGHASYREHRTGSPAASVSPAPQGLLMRLGIPLTGVLLAGDLVFPFLAVLLLAWGLRRPLGSPWLGAAAALVVAADIGTYWFRAANPQIPFLLLFGWIAASFVLPRERTASWLVRAVLVGALVWVHPVYASFAIFADAVSWVSEVAATRSWKAALRSGAAYGVTFLAVVLPRFLLSLPPDVAQDTFYRLGIIRTHVPAVPSQQILLLAAMGVLLLLRWRRICAGEGTRHALILLTGALLACNQAILHGADAVFAAYYPHLIRITLLVAGAMVLVEILPRIGQRRVLASTLAAFWMGAFGLEAAAQAQISRQAVATLEASDVPAVLTRLRTMTGSLVVAAPTALNERIPSETAHYVLFNEYGWNQPSTDAELAERYALQARLIPSSRLTEGTYTAVFGGYAGLTASKTRATCRLRERFFPSGDPCNTKARDLIRHPDLLAVADTLGVDVPVVLRKYSVEILVTESGASLADVPKDRCALLETIGIYALWTCKTPANELP